MLKIIGGFLALIMAFSVLHGVVGASQNFGLPDLTAGCMRDENLFWVSFCDFFNGFLGKDDSDFLNIMATIGIAILTVLISVAVFIFNRKKDFEILDRNVILEHVVDARHFLVYLSLVYAPLLFWSGSSYLFRIVEVIVWFVGVCFLGRVLFKSYRWMKREQFDLRYKYLKNLNNPQEMSENWHSVWAVENIDGYNEREFIKIFSNTIDKLLRNSIENKETVLGLVKDFNLCIDKRSINSFKEYFLKNLEWNFFAWKKEFQSIYEEKDSHYGELFGIFISTRVKIGTKLLKEGNVFYLVDGFVSHIEKHKEFFLKIKQGGKNFYVNGIMPDFFDTLAKSTESNEDHWIWRNFPSEWKITPENIKKQENYICKSLHRHFLHWAKNRIAFPINKSGYDTVWDKLVPNLFPSVCPFMWAEILTFLMRGWVSYNRDNRIRSLIENPRNCGGSGRVMSGRIDYYEKSGKKIMEDMEKQKKVEEKETISLALLSFGDDFTQDNLNKYIDELKEMEGHYKDEGIEIRRKRYIDIFGELLEARCEKDAEK